MKTVILIVSGIIFIALAVYDGIKNTKNKDKR